MEDFPPGMPGCFHADNAAVMLSEVTVKTLFQIKYQFALSDITLSLTVSCSYSTFAKCKHLVRKRATRALVGKRATCEMIHMITLKCELLRVLNN